MARSFSVDLWTAEPIVTAAAREGARYPNVVLVVLDTARADAFEPYGAPAGSTPTVAQLAARGAVMPAFATSCWTLPSHVSMFTGRLPRTVSLGTAPDGMPMSCRPLLEAQSHRLLPEVLRRAGYRTAGVSTNLWIADYSGFSTGFDEFVVVRSGRAARLEDPRPRARLAWAWQAARAAADDGAAATAAVLGRWIDEGPPQPFFWFFNLMECHSPYMPPRPYNDLGLWQRIRAGEDARRHLTLAGVWRATLGDFDVPDDALARMRHLYARSVRSMDDWLARLLELLDARGVLDDTVVVVTADHGENLGDGALLGHGFSLDDRLLRVPLVAAGPGTERWTTPEGPVSLAALPRLIAEAVGLTGHPWDDPEWPAGLAIAQFDAVHIPDGADLSTAETAWGLGAEGVGRITIPRSCATDGRWKLLRAGTDEELFDLVADPLEIAPLPAGAGDGPDAPAAPLAALRHALDDAAAREVPAASVNGGGRGVAGGAGASPGEMADLEDRMRLLGYL